MKRSPYLILPLFLSWTFPAPAPAQLSGADSVETSLIAVLSATDSLSILYFTRKQNFIESLLHERQRRRSDHFLRFDFPGHGFTPATALADSSFIRRGADVDYVGRDLAQRQTNSSQVLDLGRALSGFLQLFNSSDDVPAKVAPSELSLPTKDELNILNLLWKSGTISGPEIYANLPASVHLTAEMLWNKLDAMARTGFVDAKQISPQHTFTLATPFFTIPIEISSKNRKNKVFQYKARVDRRELWEYLEAQRYLAARHLDSPRNRGILRQFDELLELMARGENPKTSVGAPN